MPNDDFVVILDDADFAALDKPKQRAAPSIHPAWHHHCRVVISDAGFAWLAQQAQHAKHARSPPCAA
jgi:hypothetical protein